MLREKNMNIAMIERNKKRHGAREREKITLLFQEKKGC
jgi:hypothetical protein